MLLEELISTYGYAAIAVGTFLEGETILILAGFAAHRGYLELPWVLVSAFLGTLLGDQFYFYIGRAKGQSVLDKRPDWKSKSEKVLSLFNKHQVWLILGFRFIYGLRTVTPFVLGLSRVSRLRFLILNALGAFAWAIVIGVLGYLFGHTVEVIIGDIKRYELWIFIGLAALGGITWSVHWRSKKK
jgi:membrane protein DedA with SNARE-associated domain